MKRRTAEALKIRSPKNEKLELVKSANMETPKAGKASRQRANGTVVRKLSFELPDELVVKLGVYCAEKRCTMVAVVEEGVREMLSRG